MDNLSNFGRFALNLSKEAGKLILGFHNRRTEQIWTDKIHFKTVADNKSDALIRKAIRESFPNHNIHSEEGEYVNKSSEYTWICDAVDGTINLWSAFTDHFSVCIALCKNDEPIVGAICVPKREEVFIAEKGRGAFLNGKKLQPLTDANINHALVGVDSGKNRRRSHLPVLNTLLEENGINCNLGTGCASVPLCLAASGVIHGYIATDLEPEDMAAAVIINRQAGNKVTDLSGAEWKLGDRSIVVANPELHKNILALLVPE